MNTIEILLEKIESAKDLDFGTIFNDSIELFKKVWVQGLIAMILNMVLLFPIMFMVYIPMILLGIINPESFEQGGKTFSELDGLSILILIATLMLMIVMVAALITISVALKAAFYRITKNKDLGIQESDDYFYFLKKEYLKKSVGLGLIITLVILLAYLLCVLPIFYVIVPVYYMLVIYALNPDMSSSDIVKSAFRLGNKKWLLTFGLLFVAWISSFIVGFLMCFIGLYVTQQFIDIPAYQVYKQVIGFDDKNEIEQIGIGD